MKQNVRLFDKAILVVLEALERVYDCLIDALKTLAE